MDDGHIPYPAADIDPKVAALDFRAYRPGDEAAILRAFNAVFGGHPDFEPRTLASWRWQFADNPFGLRYQLAVTPDGEVAAQYPCTPAPFVTPEGIRSVAQAVDIMARPEWRKGAHPGPSAFAIVGERASLECFERGEIMIYGYPMPRALAMGLRYLNLDVVRIVDYLVRQVGVVGPDVPPGIELREGMPEDAELDRIERATRAGRKLATLRDARWFRWRYATCPHAAYSFVQARRAGELVGLLVLRCPHATALRGATIADWIAVDHDDEVIDALIAHVEGRVRATGGQGMAAIAPPWSPEFHELRARKFGVIPTAWTIERHLTYRVPPALAGTLSRERLAEEWYYTFGDSDLV